MNFDSNEYEVYPEGLNGVSATIRLNDGGQITTIEAMMNYATIDGVTYNVEGSIIELIVKKYAQLN